METSVDVELRLFDPSVSPSAGKDEGQVADSPYQFKGPDSISAIASTNGEWRIEVFADPSQPGGEYSISIDGPREPTLVDLQRLAAEKAFREAKEAVMQPGAESHAVALAKFQESLEHWRVVGDTRWTAYTECWIGRVYKFMGRVTDSLRTFDEATAMLTAAGDEGGKAYLLNEKGAAIRDLDTQANALPVYEEALAVRQRLADKRGAAQILNNIGLIYKNTGQAHQALEKYQAAIALYQEVNDPYNEAYVRNNLAGAEEALGDSSTAIDNFTQVLNYCADKRCDELGNKNLEILAENNLAIAYENRGETELALQHYQRAWDVSIRLENDRGQGLALNNLGWLYFGVGDSERALEYLQQSLTFRRKINIPGELAVTVNNIAYIYATQGKVADATKYVEESGPISERINDKQFASYAQDIRGLVFAATGKFDAARQSFERALTLQKELGDRRAQGISLDKLAQLSHQEANPELAGNAYELALQNWIASGDRQGQALTLYNYAAFESERGNLASARDKVEAAIDIVESLRTTLSSDQLRRTYFASKQDFYALDIDVRMRLFRQTGNEADRDAAIAASERSRARNLLDLLQEANFNGGAGVDPKLSERAGQLQAELTATSESLLKQKALQHAEDAAAVSKRLELLERDDDQLQAQIRKSRPGYAALKQPQPLTVKEIQRLLDPGTLLLEYSLGEKQSYVWALTSAEVHSYLLARGSEIEHAAHDLRVSLRVDEGPQPNESAEAYAARLTRSRSEFKVQSDNLSQLVLNPIAAQLNQAKRLVIVADGGLNYIPFECLPAPGVAGRDEAAGAAVSPLPLTSSKEIVYQPSISALALIRETRRSAAAKSVVVLANPVFNPSDKRVARSDKSVKPSAVDTASAKSLNPPSSSVELTRALRDFGGESNESLVELPYSDAEADAIIAAVPRGQGLKVSGFDATLARATSPELSRYDIVHFATHAFLDEKHPGLSGIVLSLVDRKGNAQAGFLNLYNVYNLHLPVSLIVLSACQTGIGESVRGEGLIGLTRGFMYAGAARVIASLWKVDDEATAAFMGHFYQHLLREKMTAAAALRAARADLIQERAQWRAPFYWAGFVMQGEWQ